MNGFRGQKVCDLEIGHARLQKDFNGVLSKAGWHRWLCRYAIELQWGSWRYYVAHNGVGKCRKKGRLGELRVMLQVRQAVVGSHGNV